VHPGDVVTIQVTFAPGSAEVFPVYNPQTEELDDQTESLHVSWFITGGIFEHDRTGVAAVDAGEIATSTSNQWTAPTQPGTHVLWIVLARFARRHGLQVVQRRALRHVGALGGPP